MELYNWNAFGMDNLTDAFGPGNVDMHVRYAIQACWASLPEGQRTPEAVEEAFRQIVDRALRGYREYAVRLQKGVKGI